MSLAASPPAANAPLLALRGLDKVYANGTEALRGIALDLAQGEFLSVLGPSGCGKSTLLRIIAGLSRPTGGTVAWAKGAAPRPGGIGYVFQEPTLLPWSTVFDNVWLPLRLRGVSRGHAEADIRAMLERVGLLSAAGAVPRELSGGMRMRVSIARALVTRPRLLLMDEPFAALDEISRFALNADLLALRESQGFSTVFVTHSVFESVFLSSRIAVMAARPGRIAASLAVPLPYPRLPALRTAPAYSALCRDVSDALAGAMAPA